MIGIINLELFKREYRKFRKTKDYSYRKSQSRFVEIAKLIIKELIKKEEITNKDLTALIQMFGANCKKETFYSYLLNLKLPKDVREDIYNKFIAIGETGYTGRGKAAVKGLNETQLKDVQELLKSASEAKTKDEVKKSYIKYKKKNVPQVTRGVYSPWLHYLQPKICPLIAGPVSSFLLKLGLDRSTSYSDLIDIFEELKHVVDEEDLGLIDQYFFGEERINILLVNHTVAYKDALTSILENKKQIILYGPPGTGKTYRTKIIAIGLVRWGG